MLDPTRSNEPQDPPGSSKHQPPVARFGEFSGSYRARLALSHPDMERRWPADSDSESQRRVFPGASQAPANGPEAETGSADTPPRRYV